MDYIKLISETPIPNIFVISGILFLLLSVSDKLIGELSVPDTRKRQAMILGFVLLVAGLSLIVSPTLKPPVSEPKTETPEAPPASILTGWLLGGEYEMEWARLNQRGYYPVSVEGKSDENGVNLYRSEFKPSPANVKSWYSYRGQTRANDQMIDDNLKASGHKRVWLQSFIDGAGTERFQGVWLKTD